MTKLITAAAFPAGIESEFRPLFANKLVFMIFIHFIDDYVALESLQ